MVFPTVATLVAGVVERDAAPGPEFVLAALADLDGSSLSTVSLAPLLRAEWLLPLAPDALAVNDTWAADALALQWAFFDADRVGGPLREAP